MTQLVLSAEVKADTTEIIDELTRKAGSITAAGYLSKFRAAVERISELPRSGAPRPALGVSTRCIVISPYLLIYDYAEAEDTLTVLRIIHGRRKLGPGIRTR
jgi:plasmid stabilization system protein ParE